MIPSVRSIIQDRFSGIVIESKQQFKARRDRDRESAVEAGEGKEKEEQKEEKQTKNQAQLLLDKEMKTMLQQHFSKPKGKEEDDDNDVLLLRFRLHDAATTIQYTEKVRDMIIQELTTNEQEEETKKKSSKKKDKKKIIFDAERCKLQDEDFKRILELFSCQEQVSFCFHSLLLAGNELTSSSIELLSSSITDSLQHLGVTANPLGNCGLSRLIDFLSSSCSASLIKLHATRIAFTSKIVSTSKISKETVERFFEVVSKKPNLTKVYFKQQEYEAFSLEEMESSVPSKIEWK